MKPSALSNTYYPIHEIYKPYRNTNKTLFRDFLSYILSHYDQHKATHTNTFPTETVYLPYFSSPTKTLAARLHSKRQNLDGEGVSQSELGRFLIF